jgi:3D (Asp-Asp-Asp) domain-containing protein
MSKRLLFLFVLYFLIAGSFPKVETQTAVASTESFSPLSANSSYEPPSYISSETTITAVNSPIYSYKKEEAEIKQVEVTTSSIGIYFRTSAYNSLVGQTDSTPCIPASGNNICGRTNVVACPRRYPLGTKFIIEGKEYICEDRLNERVDNGIDIFLDKDLQSALNWGVRYLEVQVVE